MATFRLHFGYMLATCWRNVGYILATCWLHVQAKRRLGRIPAHFRDNVGSPCEATRAAPGSYGTFWLHCGYISKPNASSAEYISETLSAVLMMATRAAPAATAHVGYILSQTPAHFRHIVSSPREAPHAAPGSYSTFWLHFEPNTARHISATFPARYRQSA